MATKSRRIEMRADADEEQLIVEAAQRLHLSVSVFVVGAATAEAGRVLARADTTLMPAAQFDELIGSLGSPDSAPRLSRVAARPRRFTR